MKPFDLKAALNGAPVKLENGRKAFVLYDLRKYPSLLKASGRLPLNGIMMGNSEDDGDHVTWDETGKSENSYCCIAGMWEEPKLTTEQIFEKAYAEDLPLNAAGKAAFVVAKTKNGGYILQIGEDYVYKADLSLDWDFYKSEQVKPKTITVTLPRPVKPRPGKDHWFIGVVNNTLCVDKMCDFFDGYRVTPDGNYFASEADAQAWLDALKEAMGDE